TWAAISERFSELARDHLGTRTDVVALALQHDTPDAMATPHGRVRDWKKGECEAVPGLTMPALVEVERDYTQVHAKFTSIGPLLEEKGMTTKGLTYDVSQYVEEVGRLNGVHRSGPAA